MKKLFIFGGILLFGFLLFGCLDYNANLPFDGVTITMNGYYKIDKATVDAVYTKYNVTPPGYEAKTSYETMVLTLSGNPKDHFMGDALMEYLDQSDKNGNKCGFEVIDGYDKDVLITNPMRVVVLFDCEDGYVTGNDRLVFWYNLPKDALGSTVHDKWQITANGQVPDDIAGIVRARFEDTAKYLAEEKQMKEDAAKNAQFEEQQYQESMKPVNAIPTAANQTGFLVEFDRQTIDQQVRDGTVTVTIVGSILGDYLSYVPGDYPLYVHGNVLTGVTPRLVNGQNTYEYECSEIEGVVNFDATLQDRMIRFAGMIFGLNNSISKVSLEVMDPGRYVQKTIKGTTVVSGTRGITNLATNQGQRKDLGTMNFTWTNRGGEVNDMVVDGLLSYYSDSLILSDGVDLTSSLRDLKVIRTFKANDQNCN